MNLTFAHIVSIVGAPIAFVAQMNPAILAAVYPPAAPYGALLVGAAVALVNLGHSIMTAKPAAAATVAKLLPLFAVALMFSGCADIEAFLKTPTGDAVALAAVDIAVATAEAKGVPDTQINKIAHAALAADTGVSGTLASLSSLVDSQIASTGLPAADLAAAKILEVALSASITAKIGNNADLAAAQAAIATVLNEVIAVTGG